MAWYDTVGKLLGGAVDFVSDNKGWIKPAANFALGAYGDNQVQNAQGQLIDFYNNQEEKNFKNYQERLAYEQALAAEQGGGGGGGGGGPSPEEIRRAYEAKLEKIRQVQALYKPYTDAGSAVLPAATEAYLAGTKALGGLAQGIITPNRLQNAGRTPITPSQAVIPLPAHMRKP